MIRLSMRLSLLLLLAPLAGGADAQEDDITIYRCTGAGGQLTLQDSPCGKDQSQQTRRMLQPQDPPPGAAPAMLPKASQPAPEPPPRVIVQRAPQPLYECVAPDGDTYTSDDGIGNPRWVSSWSLYDAVPAYGPGIGYSRSAATAAGTSIQIGVGVRSGSAGNDASHAGIRRPPPVERPLPPTRGPGHGRGHGYDYGPGYGYDAGMWLRDECHVLPQAETCARLHDRRDEVRRRFFNAQANERATLDKEERGINARLSADCGGA